MMWKGYARGDGSVGIRNHILVIYTVECSSHVVRAVAEGAEDVHVVGFTGCTDNQYAVDMILSCARHPNVGAVLAVGLGCEYIQPRRIAELVRESGRPAEWFYIQDTSGTAESVRKAREIVEGFRTRLSEGRRDVSMGWADLVVGAECGGSDATSGLAANPAVGRFFDLLVDAGGTAVWEEIVEMIGLRDVLAERAASEASRLQITAAYDKMEEYCRSVRQYAVSPGNFVGGLTTIEEKSLGAYAKSGSRPVQGVIRSSQRPPYPGLWLLDSVPDPHFMQFGYNNPSDTEGIMDLLSTGCHMAIYTTGRGSVTGSAIVPVIKVTGNATTYARMEEDMDFDASGVLAGDLSLDETGVELGDLVARVAGGEPS